MVAVARFGRENTGSRWVSLGDPVMGGRSTGRVAPVDDTISVFHGEVSLANGGGFASVKCDLPPLDLSGFEGLVLAACGDGKVYKFGIRMTWDRNAPVYQQAFATEAEVWQRINLPFHRFTPTFRGRVLADAAALDLANICSVSLFIADKQAGPFRLMLRAIDTY